MCPDEGTSFGRGCQRHANDGKLYSLLQMVQNISHFQFFNFEMTKVKAFTIREIEESRNQGCRSIVSKALRSCCNMRFVKIRKKLSGLTFKND